MRQPSEKTENQDYKGETKGEEKLPRAPSQPLLQELLPYFHSQVTSIKAQEYTAGRRGAEK